MPGLTDDKIAMLKGLMAASPDEVVKSLQKAVCKEGATGPLAAIGEMVQAETADRAVRAITFAPLMPMFGSPSDDGRPTFPRGALIALWRGLKADAPSLMEEATAASYYIDPLEPWPGIFDLVCVRAASGLRDGRSPDYVAAAAACDAVQPGLGKTLALALEIAPVVRPPMMNLGDWLQRMTEERRAIARLAYRDAEAAAQGGGPLMFEMLASHLKQPWMILRIATSMMEHPGERYLAASELSIFGERTLADVEFQIQQVRDLSLNTGPDAARKAGRAVHRAIEELGEFEQSIQLSKDAPWGQRVVKLKQGLAALVESRLRDIDTAVAGALPMHKVRYSARLSSTAPKLTEAPDEDAVRWSLGLLTFAEDIRGCSTEGGFGGLRGKVLESVGKRLDQYVEDVLEQMRVGDVQRNDELAREYLDVAARLLTLARDKQSAAIVRRRAAAA